MALTIKKSKSGRRIYVKFDASTDLDFASPPISLRQVTLFGVVVKSSAINDVITVRENDAAGCPIFIFKDISAGGGAWNFDDEICTPFVAAGEVSSGVEAIFYIRGF